MSHAQWGSSGGRVTHQCHSCSQAWWEGTQNPTYSAIRTAKLFSYKGNKSDTWKTHFQLPLKTWFMKSKQQSQRKGENKMVPCHFSALQPIASHTGKLSGHWDSSSGSLVGPPQGARLFTIIFLCSTCMAAHIDSSHPCTLLIWIHKELKLAWTCTRMGGCCSSGAVSSSVRVLLTLCMYNTLSIHLIRFRSHIPFLFFKTPLHLRSRPVRLWSSCISELNSSGQ